MIDLFFSSDTVLLVICSLVPDIFSVFGKLNVMCLTIFILALGDVSAGAIADVVIGVVLTLVVVVTELSVAQSAEEEIAGATSLISSA